MLFPYDRYQTSTEPFTLFYPAGEEQLARWISATLTKASQALSSLLAQPVPEFEVLIVKPEDWPLVPHGDLEEGHTPHPYWTDETSPPTIVVPTEVDPIFGTMTSEKIAFMLYHELSLAFLEADERPWPEESPLWADEWQFKFAALWLSHQLDHVSGIVNQDLLEQYADIFEVEPDGKTPVTVRGFDWYEDTSAEDYLCYQLLLEQFAADLLAHYDGAILPRFLGLYRQEYAQLLSDDVTALLAKTLGANGETWLESLDYF